MLNLKNILYVYSESVDNNAAIKKAVMLAKKNQANLTVLFTLTDDAFPDSLGLTKEEIANFIDKKEAERDKLLSQLSSSITIKKECIYSNSYIDVIKIIQQHSFDILIKPSQNEGVIGKLFGSNDMGYLRQCPCPVWLINTEDKENSHSIIAAVDVNNNYPVDEREVREKLNLDVLIAAASLAVAEGCSLKIVSAWSAQYESTLRYSTFIKKSEDDVNAYVNLIEKQHSANFDAFMEVAKNVLGKETISFITPECIAIKGNPRDVLPEYANKINADVVVMGTVARVGVPGLIIGNTAENILYRLNQSVLAIKPEGAESLID